MVAHIVSTRAPRHTCVWGQGCAQICARVHRHTQTHICTGYTQGDVHTPTRAPERTHVQCAHPVLCKHIHTDMCVHTPGTQAHSSSHM